MLHPRTFYQTFDKDLLVVHQAFLERDYHEHRHCNVIDHHNSNPTLHKLLSRLHHILDKRSSHYAGQDTRPLEMGPDGHQDLGHRLYYHDSLCYTY